MRDGEASRSVERHHGESRGMVRLRDGLFSAPWKAARVPGDGILSRVEVFQVIFNDFLTFGL